MLEWFEKTWKGIFGYTMLVWMDGTFLGLMAVSYSRGEYWDFALDFFFFVFLAIVAWDHPHRKRNKNV